ncbi:MAG: hypothetical protein M1814_005880 [Vezdaea aestivalis]|nr:MAG: hypothetical protein M1814_005880 [Vezdaea aestivalis]
MPPSEDKQWASKYLLDPLTAPEPSDETGPGSSFGNTLQQSRNPFTSPENIISKKPVTLSTLKASSTPRSGLPTPPTSASPQQNATFDAPPTYRREALAPDQLARRREKSAEPKRLGDGSDESPRRRRGSSLTSRFPGDQTHRPLDTLRRENKMAERSPHLRRKYMPGTDLIDQLDIAPLGQTYHHEGPFDAALRSRNLSKKYSPLDAVRGSNNEALRATPPGRIKDSLEKHRPLDGVSSVPSGEEDIMSGHRLQYEEGTDLMIEEGQYKRWAGMVRLPSTALPNNPLTKLQKYLPEDLKGKGEPSYSIEKALKDSKVHRRVASDGNAVFEMAVSPRMRSSSTSETKREKDRTKMSYSEWEQDIRRSHGGSGTGLKKRLSLGRRQHK